MKDGQPDGDCVIRFDRASLVIGAVADTPNYWILVRNFQPPVDGQVLTLSQGDETNNTLGSFSKRSTPLTKTDSYTSFPLQELKELSKLFKKYFGYDYPDAVYTSFPSPLARANSTQETIPFLPEQAETDETSNSTFRQE
jgi:hypothetical protein